METVRLELRTWLRGVTILITCWSRKNRVKCWKKKTRKLTTARRRSTTSLSQ